MPRPTPGATHLHDDRIAAHCVRLRPSTFDLRLPRGPRRGRALRSLCTSACLAFLAAAPCAAQTAQYQGDLSFALPGRGLPGGAEEPIAVEADPGGDLHVLDRKVGKVYVFNARGQYQRSYPNGNGGLRGATALALDATGRAFILEGDARRVTVVATDGSRAGTIGTPGNTPGTLRRPLDVAVGPDGYVYVLDAGSRSVLVYSLDGVLVREAAFDARIGDPRALAVGPNGSVYIADAKSPGALHAAPPFSEWPWRGPLDAVLKPLAIRGGTVADPSAVAVTRGGLVLVLDGAQGRLWGRDPADGGAGSDRLYGGPGSGPGAFEHAVDVAVAGPGAVVILDGRVRKLERIHLSLESGAADAAGGLPVHVTFGNPQLLPGRLLKIHSNGSATELIFDAPRRGVSRVLTRPSSYRTAYGDSATAFLPDPQGRTQEYAIPGLARVGDVATNDTFLVVTDPERNRFVAFTLRGRLVGTFGDAYRDQRRLQRPQGVAFFPDGRLLVADQGNNQTKVFSPDLVTLLETQPFPRVTGVAMSPDGVAYAWADDGQGFSRRDPQSGRWARVAGPVPERVGGASFDPTGNLFVLNRATHQVEVFRPDAKPLFVFGQPGRLRQPGGLFLDAGGNVYLADDVLGQTFLYHWHVSLPAPSDVAVQYGDDGTTLSWPSVGPLAKGYAVYGVLEAGDGQRAAARRLGFTSGPRFTIAPERPRAGEPAVSAVRIATVSTFGTEGEPGPATPVPGAAAQAALLGGEHARALEYAQRAVDQAEAAGDRAGVVAARSLLLTAAIAAGRYKEAVAAGEALRPELGAERTAELRVQLARAHLGRGDHRAAANQLIVLAGDSAGRSAAARPDVQALSFRIAHAALERLDTAGALGFLRNYAIALPPGPVRDRVRDTLAVTDTRAKLATGLRAWQDLEYGAATLHLESLLQSPEAQLTQEQRVLALQLLSAAYYGLGRREDARRAYLRILEIDPSFQAARGNESAQRRHGLVIYNHEMLRFFEQARR